MALAGNQGLGRSAKVDDIISSAAFVDVINSAIAAVFWYRKRLGMLLSLGLILLCQLLGEAIAHVSGVPIPGPVIGLLLCVLLLLVRDQVAWLAPNELRDGTFEKTGHGILGHLSLLFIPAGVGVIQRLDVLAGNAIPILFGIVISTALSLMVTALVFTFVARLTHE